MKIRTKPPTAGELIKEIEAHLPLPVYPTPEVAQSLRQQGKDVRADEEMQVTSVMDSGEAGGILCAIESKDKKEVMMISLTHLRIRADHLCTRASSPINATASANWHGRDGGKKQ